MPAEIMLTLHKFPKKEILLPKKIENFWKIRLHKFPKKEIYFFKKIKLPKKETRVWTPRVQIEIAYFIILHCELIAILRFTELRKF